MIKKNKYISVILIMFIVTGCQPYMLDTIHNSDNVQFVSDNITIKIPTDSLVNVVQSDIKRKNTPKLYTKKEMADLRGNIFRFVGLVNKEARRIETVNIDMDYVRRVSKYIHAYYSGYMRVGSHDFSCHIYTDSLYNIILTQLVLQKESGVEYTESVYYKNGFPISLSKHRRQGVLSLANWHTWESTMYESKGKEYLFNRDCVFEYIEIKTNKKRKYSNDISKRISKKEGLNTKTMYEFASYIVKSEKWKCLNRNATYSASFYQFKEFLRKNYDYNTNKLLEKNYKVNVMLEMTIDEIGKCTIKDVSIQLSSRNFKKNRKVNLEYNRIIKNEIIRMMVLTKWIPAKKDCKTISSKKIINIYFNSSSKFEANKSEFKQIKILNND